MTYLHLTGALALTAVSSETPVRYPYANIIQTILVFVVLFLLMGARPGPYKYILFAAFCILFGQILSPVVRDLEARGQLREVLASVAGIFVAMTVVGFADKQNLLGFGGYLLAALVGLILARLLLIVVKLGNPSASVGKVNTLLNWVGTALFAVFVAYDTQLLKHRQNQRQMQRNPDYVDASLGLFLDIINLFSLQSDS